MPHSSQSWLNGLLHQNVIGKPAVLFPPQSCHVKLHVWREQVISDTLSYPGYLMTLTDSLACLRFEFFTPHRRAYCALGQILLQRKAESIC